VLVAMQKQVKVLINGRFYKLASDAEEQDINSAAQLVDNLIKSCSTGEGAQQMSSDLTLRVALQIALDYAKSQKNVQLQEEKIGRLLSLIDQENM